MSAIGRIGGAGRERNLSGELADMQAQVEEVARAAGLDFFPTVFELMDYEEMSMLAAFGGFPVRYPHWRWGMEYERFAKGYAYGLQKIYEMVINTDPCYAYLLNVNEATDQKLVMAHVYAHADCFKNNAWFAGTNRKMLAEMAGHAARIRHYADRVGQDSVETFIDASLSLENLIDVHAPYVRRRASGPEDRRHAGDGAEEVRADEGALPEVERFKLRSQRLYMDRYINPPDEVERRERRARDSEAADREPLPTSDVLLYLLEHAPLKSWEQDVLSIVREEAYYFAPQGMTKILNEGWATFWHTRLMTGKLASAAEIVDYADHHSGTVAMHGGALNPYKLGLELLRDIEERWNKGRFGTDWERCDDMRGREAWDLQLGGGLAKVFEVRATHNDVTLIDEFLTEDFCRRHRLFSFRHDATEDRYVIESREFDAIRRKLLLVLTNMGQPRLDVVDGNFENRGELYLVHRHEGVDLQLGWARASLANLVSLWRRPCNVETVVEERRTLLRHDGQKLTQRTLD